MLVMHVGVSCKAYPQSSLYSQPSPLRCYQIDEDTTRGLRGLSYLAGALKRFFYHLHLSIEPFNEPFPVNKLRPINNSFGLGARS